MMKPLPSLQNMPHFVIDKVVDNDFKTLQRLRKVCRTLWINMDEMKLEANLESIEIILTPEVIYITYDGHTTVQYQTHNDGCQVVYLKKRKILEGQNFVTTFLWDLEHILKYHKSLLQKLNLNWNFRKIDKDFVESTVPLIFKKLKSILESRRQQLKMEELSISASDQSQVMSILPYLDSKFLKSIKIINSLSKSEPYYEGQSKHFDIDQIVELEQFKNIENFEIQDFTISATIQNFIHLSTIYIHLESVSANDLLLLKKAFLQSATLNIFNIKYEEFEDKNYFVDAMNQADEREWYFRIPDNEDQLLRILDPSWWIVDFSRVNITDVHENVEIQD